MQQIMVGGSAGRSVTQFHTHKTDSTTQMKSTATCKQKPK